jgi:hypothetical protein
MYGHLKYKDLDINRLNSTYIDFNRLNSTSIDINRQFDLHRFIST